MPAVSLAAASTPLLLALDAGTSSVRALAFDAQGRTVSESEEQIPYTLETSREGRATFPAAALFDLTIRAVDGAVARLGDRAGEVAAVGTSSIWHSLLGLDAAGEATTPVLYWVDRRSAAAAVQLRSEVDAEAIRQRTGCRLHSSYWPAKLRWLRQDDPDAFARTSRWLSFAEYALDRLCGPDAGAVTFCMASGTGLLDVHTLDWDAEVLDLVAVNTDQLSPLVNLGPPGRLHEEFARRWPSLADAAWFPALGDGACANVGSCAFDPTRMALTVGTSAAVRLVAPRPPGEAWSVPAGLWAYRLDRQRAVLGGALSNGGNLLRWVWETTGASRDDETTAAATALPPDATGLTFLPFLAGERSPGWHDEASGVIAGLTLATKPEHLIRAGLEAVAYRLADVYEALPPLAATEHQIVVSGGGILGMPAWLQITADTLGHSLTALASDDETTARGAALIAAVGAGVVPSLEAVPDVALGTSTYEPDPDTYDRYQTGRARQQRLEQALVQTGEFL